MLAPQVAQPDPIELYNLTGQARYEAHMAGEPSAAFFLLLCVLAVAISFALRRR